MPYRRDDDDWWSLLGRVSRGFQLLLLLLRWFDTVNLTACDGDVKAAQTVGSRTAMWFRAFVLCSIRSAPRQISWLCRRVRPTATLLPKPSLKRAQLWHPQRRINNWSFIFKSCTLKNFRCCYSHAWLTELNCDYELHIVWINCKEQYTVYFTKNGSNNTRALSLLNIWTLYFCFFMHWQF